MMATEAGVQQQNLTAIGAAADRLGAAIGPSARPEPSWEDKLAAVATEVHGGGSSARSDDRGSGSSVAPPWPPLPSYLEQLAEAIEAAPTSNQVAFLPLGTGGRALVARAIASAAAASAGKHVVLVVDRPAQALAHGDRLRREVGLPVGVFAGAAAVGALVLPLPIPPLACWRMELVCRGSWGLAVGAFAGAASSVAASLCGNDEILGAGVLTACDVRAAGGRACGYNCGSAAGGLDSVFFVGVCMWLEAWGWLRACLAGLVPAVAAAPPSPPPTMLPALAGMHAMRHVQASCWR